MELAEISKSHIKGWEDVLVTFKNFGRICLSQECLGEMVLMPCMVLETMENIKKKNSRDEAMV